MAPKYSNKLTGKRILVIGGTSGIGFCVAEACLEFGALVTVASSRQEKIDNTIKRLTASYPDAQDSISGHVVDLTSSDVEAALTTLFDFATNEGKQKLDHIVNTAGDTLSVEKITDVTVAQVQHYGQVRFVSVLMIAKLAPRYIHRSSTSSVTFTGGISSTKPPNGWSTLVGWNCAKEAMVRGLAVDLAPLRFNLVAPGAIDTEYLYHMAGDDVGRNKQLVALFGSKCLLGKCGSPEDTAEAYLYLMRDTFVTGQVLKTEGGYLLV
jgi:NAD(P)-dependent dehydrogenase (short-subunit alcohol dehydrogenase family)